MRADVVIVGAGPAGSTAARELAAEGLDVLLLDRARFPRDKPCGGLVSLRCAALLPFDISPLVEDVITGARLRLRDGAETALDSAGPLAYITQRSRLDHFLVERAQEAGVEFRDGHVVRGVERGPDGRFAVRTAGQVHTAPVVVGADGANGVVARALSFEAPMESAVALEANLPYPGGVPARLRGRVTLQLGSLPGGYGWIFPRGDHVNVGVGGWKSVVGTRLRDHLRRLCRSYGLDSRALVSVRGHHLPALRAAAPRVTSGAALVGDAAGLVDPLSGEGIHNAVASAMAAAPAVADYVRGDVASLDGYQRVLERELLPELVASGALMEIFHAWPGPSVALMQRSRRFWGAMCGLLTGDLTYERLTGRGGPAALTLQPVARLARRLTTRRYGGR